MNKKDLLLSDNWEEIIAYINQERETGLQLRDICKGVISKDRMSQRIKENGYTYSHKLKTYVKSVEKMFLEDEQSPAHKIKGGTEKSLRRYKNTLRFNGIKDETNKINMLLKNLEDLERRVCSLENPINRKDSNFNPIHFNEEPILKSFKLYPSAVEAIEKLNRHYSGFKKQDLLSSLIVQAVAQYIELTDSNEG
ncbi:hypothetical protein GMA92_15205 [Turicibacter sanguinis]|uniref:Uncharacterized protein n=1 Tax=Turicibacter sanguinis TaxID=154288 RepID=A0A9X4XGY8_9FIRM|nr:hypothetical protein GAZ90_24510 [Phocaeicola vulgatus]MTK22743.1 hypothetical protein [Turicibacter sanguinis]NAK07260.1 hypothetical protein [Escherichia coli]MTK73898.1 hypothetical protein [Turicibacter sanguinis]MTN46488.1 hypothetical protein [Turicibacter sanguinis]